MSLVTSRWRKASDPGPSTSICAHVGDIEDAGMGADRDVLLLDSVVLDRHLPAGEGNHLGASLEVSLVKRSPAQDGLINSHGTILDNTQKGRPRAPLQQADFSFAQSLRKGGTSMSESPTRRLLRSESSGETRLRDS